MMNTAVKLAIRYSLRFPCLNRTMTISSIADARPMQKTDHMNNAQNSKVDDNIHDISKAIAEKIDGMSSSLLLESHIFRVHQQLRLVNETAYEPVLLSIGPYHHGKRHLQNMEEHKVRYLNQLIKRREAKGISRLQQLNTYLTTLKELEDRARRCYDEAILLNENKFLEMMLLDGCFIIELFRESSRDKQDRDPFLKADWLHNALAGDLTLLENQLPFFVLKHLNRVISDNPDPLHLIFTALNYLPTYSYLPPLQNQREKSIARQSISDLAKTSFLSAESASYKGRPLNPQKIHDIKHLLDLVRKFMLVEETLEMESHTQRGAQQAKRAPSRDCISKRTKKFAYSAVELRDFGVKFKSAERGKFYDIRFKKAVLEIPVIRITDSMEALFRNLIAYEEHSPDDGFSYISDYMAFMDGLINSAKDVELLRRQGIIENLMGDDEAVCRLFNSINKNTVVTPKNFYQDIISRLMIHCRKRRNVWMAKLRRINLNYPWAVLSAVFGFLLLTMDITQTLYTVWSYHGSKPVSVSKGSELLKNINEE